MSHRPFINWSKSPIIVPRWMLTLKYVVLSALGTAIALATAPSLEDSLGDWLSTYWGYAILISGLLAAIGSARFRWEALERWSGSALSILLLVYALSPVLIIITEGDLDRLVYSITAIGLAMTPSARAVYLLRRTGLKLNVSNDDA